MLAVGRLWLEGLELRRVAARRIGVLEPSGRVGSLAAVEGKIKRRNGANRLVTERPADR